MTNADAVVTALHDALVTGFAEFPSTVLEKNTAIPLELNAGNRLVIIRDGEPGEPETMLGGFRTAYYSHLIPIELFAAHGDSTLRDSQFAALVTRLGVVLENNLTLDGLVQAMEYAAPSPFTEDLFGGADIKSGVVTVRVEYQAETPLG